MSEAGDMAERLHDDAAGWDPRGTAFEMVRRALSDIDRNRARVGQARLVDADLTVRQRTNGICALLHGPQDAVTVADAAARTVALLMFLLRAEDASPFTGDAA